jgi:hypothetical protein
LDKKYKAIISNDHNKKIDTNKPGTPKTRVCILKTLSNGKLTITAPKAKRAHLNSFFLDCMFYILKTKNTICKW